MQLICAPPTRAAPWRRGPAVPVGLQAQCGVPAAVWSTHVVPGAVQSCRSSGCQQTQQQKQQEGANARLHRSVRSSANTVQRKWLL